MRGSYKLAQVEGGHAFFGEVRISVSPLQGKRVLCVEFSTDGHSNWDSAVELGLRYAWDHLPGSANGGEGAAVRVTKTRGHLVDTSNILMVYVAARALADAYGVSDFSSVSFSERDATFTFLK